MIELKKKLIEISKKAQKIGLCKHKSGNFSIRDRETNYILITPSGIDREKLEIDDICVLDLKGNIIYSKEGLKPSSETMMHIEIYNQREDVFSVAHTHSKFGTAFAILNKKIPAVVFEAAGFGLKKGYIPVAKYARPGTYELAKSVVEPVSIADMFLLEKHGVVAVGKDIDESFLNVQYAEELAELYYLSLVINKGDEPPIFNVEELNSWKYPDKFKTLND